MKNFVQNGNSLDLVASTSYSSGDIVIEGNLVGVAVTDIASGETGAVSVSGVYEFTKESAALWLKVILLTTIQALKSLTIILQILLLDLLLK